VPRSLVVGNGNLLICLDQYLHLRDLYYPHVGELNHVIGHYHRLGIWIDDDFSWLSHDDWEITPGYREDTLVTEAIALNTKRNLKLTVNDTVIPEKNIYLRRVTAEDLSQSKIPREIRLFFCQDFYLYESDIGDTAFYDPHSEAVIHYKRETYFLCSGLLNGKTPMTDYSCGTKKFHGAEGTWKDAEDGKLSKNPIAQGSVDSAMGFLGVIGAKQPLVLDYWIIADETLKAVRTQHQYIRATGCETHLQQTESYWRNWAVSPVNLNLTELPFHLESLFKRSLLTIRTQTDNGGAITAANDTDYFSFARDTYSYMWPRDGAFVAYALDQTGHQELTRRFFRFCHEIFQDGFTPTPEAGSEQQGFFYHKYTPRGAVGSSWHSWMRDDGTPHLPIQEDETALILWSLWNHYQQYRDIEFVRSMYEDMILPAANFLCHYRDSDTGLPLPSYDLWEERLGIHTFTVASVYAGLEAAANFATMFGDTENTLKYRMVAQSVQAAALKYLWCEPKKHFYSHLLRDPKTGTLLGDETVGSSTFAMFFFGLLEADDPKTVSNMKALEDRLWVKTPVGGLARYENDTYHLISSKTDPVPGNPWIVCTMWLAQWRIAMARTKEDLASTLELLEWVSDVALPSGLLPEQLNPYTGAPISVAPLTWSHAAFVTTISLYLDKYQQLSNGEVLPETTASRFDTLKPELSPSLA
jgi:GH15 family glucan-1,4-alpha-glucosidase